ncbi:MAG: recombinase family protein [Lachnospiraceae bacterium]|nr:recombinase family protein [Lachnospiraceae bacterium]
MNRSNVNSVTDNKEQELVKGITFVRSRRAKENVSIILSEMNLVTESHGVQIDYAYQDDSYSNDYDRRELDGFFEMLKNCDVQVVVVRSLNEITTDLADVEEFVRTINGMGITVYSLENSPVPIVVSDADVR